MKRWLMRPAAALFPLAVLAGGIFSTAAALRLMACYLGVALLSGCAAEAFRNAAGCEPARRRVDGRFFGGLTMILLAGALGWGLCAWLNKADALCGALIAGVCINIEQLFEERACALGRREDGPMLAVVSALLLTAGMALDARAAAPLGHSDFYAACGAALSALVSAIVSLCVASPARVSFIPRNLGFFPRAAAQSLLYPAVCAALMWLRPDRLSALPALAGYALWRLARTPCRRTANEARALSLLLMLVCGLGAAAAAILPQAVAYARALLLALLCIFAVFTAPARRLYLGAAALLLAMALVETGALTDGARIAIAAALCAAAIAANVKPALLRRV